MDDQSNQSIQSNRLDPDPSEWLKSSYRAQGFCPCIVLEPCLDPIPLENDARPLPVLQNLSDEDPAFEDAIYEAGAGKWDDCDGYDACQEYASCMDWNQFTCKECPAFQESRPQDRFLIRIKPNHSWDFEHLPGENE